MSTLAPGTRVGPYEVLAKVATGGMGIVYRARHRTMQRDAALKVLLPSLVEDAEFIQRLHREAKAVAALRHPNIVEIYDANIEEEPYYLAMEYLPGGSLQAKLMQLRDRGQRMSERDALSVARQLASALDFAHTKGFVHRDIKPSNVLIAEDGRYVLTDFGIAAMQQGTKLTKTAVSMGTPEYMSPEQAQGRTLDRRSDLYSLGVMLYEMFTGSVPFTADTPLGVAFKHVKEAPPAVSKLRSDLTPGAKTVIDRALAKKPEDRFQSAVEFIAAIDRVVQTKPTRKSPVPWVVAGLSLLGLGAAGVFAVSLLSRVEPTAPVAPAVPAASEPQATRLPSTSTSVPVAEIAIAVSTATQAAIPTALPEPDASATQLPTATEVQATMTLEANEITPPATTAIPPTQQPSPVPTLLPKPSANTPTAAPTLATAKSTDQVAASGTPKTGQLFAFEQLPRCKRGDEAHGDLVLSTDAETVHDGRGSLQFNYAFPAVNNNYVVFKCTANLPGNSTGLAAWVYGDGSGHFLNVWIKDSANEIRQYPFGRITHTGWRQMFAVFDDKRPWPTTHIGGPDNGQLDYPISFDAFVLDGVPDGAASTGTVFIDEVFASSQPLPARPVATETSSPAEQDASVADVETPEPSGDVPAVQAGDSLRVAVKENRGSYRQWGKPVAPTSCDTDDKLGATQRFDVVLVLTNTGDRDLTDLRAKFLAVDDTPLFACGYLSNISIGSSSTVAMFTFAEIPVRQVVITTSAGETLGKACFARPSAGVGDVIVIQCR